MKRPGLLMLADGKPKVTVITYVYVSRSNGREALLAECLQSAADQGLDAYEQIIVDDGSECDLSGLVARFPKARLVRKPGSGILSSTATFNLAHILARGEYCILLPSDDLQVPGSLGGLSEALDANPSAVMAIGRAQYELQ